MLQDVAGSLVSVRRGTGGGVNHALRYKHRPSPRIGFCQMLSHGLAMIWSRLVLQRLCI